MQFKAENSVINWLTAIITMVLCVLLTGGITRLTHSGLSITEWKPIMGIVPPLSESDWILVFNKYKETPEYLYKNFGMGLNDFKDIFFWEYLHRILARGVGLLLLVFWAIFNFKKNLDRKTNLLIGVLFVLGALQGVMGWYMVKSGLVANPYVSHFRLAAHLLLAFIVMAFALYIISTLTHFEMVRPDRVTLKRIRKVGVFVAALLVITILYGAFTAGTKAGFMFNTFPLMNGELIPNFIIASGLSYELLSNPAHIQFIHRLLGISSFVAMIYYCHLLKRVPTFRKVRLTIHALVGTQVLLGVAILVLMVPLTLAVIHQLIAAMLFLTLMWSIFMIGHAKVVE